MCPFRFHLLQMINLVTTVELDQKCDKITCPVVDLHSCPAEYSKWDIQGVALYGAFFFFSKNSRFCCVNGAGSVAMLDHLVPERIPVQKPRKNVFWCRNVCGRDKSRSVCCALWCVSHY